MNYERNRAPQTSSDDDERLAELARDILLDQPTDAQAKVISEHIMALEEHLGVELDDDDFQRVGRLSYEELGGDVGAAFALVLDEVVDDEDEWQTDFDAQLEAKQEEMGRKLAPSEVSKLRDAHEDISDPDLNAKFKEIWSDGKGAFDMDTAEGRTAFMKDRMTPEQEPEPVEPLSPDATSSERVKYMDQRLAGSEVVEDE